MSDETLETQNTDEAQDAPTLDIEGIIEPQARHMAAVYARYDHAKKQVDALEAQIKARQEEIAEQMRAQNDELYQRLEQTEADMEAAQQEYTALAVDLWTEAGAPASGKTFGHGTVQVRERDDAVITDKDEAINWCKLNGLEQFLFTEIDQRRFKVAVKERIISTPENVAVIEHKVGAVLIRPALLKLAAQE